MCDLVVARQNASIRSAGRAQRVIRKGEPFCVNDPLVRGREQLFEPARVEHYCSKSGKETRLVETATANPGEKRMIKPPADEGPKKPPTSGPGSGEDAWRVYVAATTDLSGEELASLSRTQMIELVG